MVKRTGPTSMVTRNLILEVGKLGKTSPFWCRVAYELSRPTRKRCELSVSHIDLNTDADETVLVPGKVLSNGEIGHKVTVAALSFAEKAKGKIAKHGKAISIAQLIKENPKGKKVRLLA